MVNGNDPIAPAGPVEGDGRPRAQWLDRMTGRTSSNTPFLTLCDVFK
jgi:hypothetical protein